MVVKVVNFVFFDIDYDLNFLFCYYLVVYGEDCFDGMYFI